MNLTTGSEEHSESEDDNDFSYLPSFVMGNEKKLAPIKLLDKSALQLLMLTYFRFKINKKLSIVTLL